MTYLIDPDDREGPEAGPEPLRDLIVVQGMQETGIFVLLFTGDTVAAPLAGLVDGRGGAAAQLVAGTAADLGLDQDTLNLFSDDAYLLQAALGEAVVPDAS